MRPILGLILICGVAAAPADQSAPREIKFAPHPRLILPNSEIATVQKRIQTHDWAKRAFEQIEHRADEWLSKPIDLPDHGGQWSHYYACKRCGARLQTESPTRHVCPACGAVYSGWPWDDVAISRRHGDFSEASRDLGLAFRLTGEKRYADKSRQILLGYADKYLTYPLHNNQGELNKVGGGRALSQTLSEATWLIKLLQATDLVWATLSSDEIEKLRTKLFYPAAVDVIQKHQMKIHNIQCWKNSAVGLTGFLFEDKSLIADAIDGEYGFRNQLEKGITDDGPWHEGAWGYHFYTASALAPLAEAARINGINLYTPRYKSMFAAPLLMAMPDGRLPAFNDSGTATAYGNELYELALARYRDPLLARAIPTTQRANLQALLNGVDELPRSATKQPLGSRNFPASGYAILQSADLQNPTWICLKYGPHGGGHGHPDKNSFVLYAKHRIVADDAGVFAYGVPLHKQWAKTTIAHNTIAVDEKNQVEATGKCLAFLSTTDGSAALIDAGNAIPNGSFRRACFLLCDDLIVFLDTINFTDNKPHTIDLAIHPQGKWISTPSAASDSLSDAWRDIPGYLHLKDPRSTSTRRAISFPTTLSRITFTPSDTDTDFIQCTGVGRNANDRVPALLARRQGASATYLWAIEPGDPEVPLELQEQPIAPDGSTIVRVARAARAWSLEVNLNAPNEAHRLRITPAP